MRRNTLALVASLLGGLAALVATHEFTVERAREELTRIRAT